MKKSKFSDSEIMAILKQAEAGVPVPELCREHGMSRQNEPERFICIVGATAYNTHELAHQPGETVP